MPTRSHTTFSPRSARDARRARRRHGPVPAGRPAGQRLLRPVRHRLLVRAASDDEHRQLAAEAIVSQSDRGVVKTQLTIYGTAGIEFLNRFIVAVELPVLARCRRGRPRTTRRAFFDPASNIATTTDRPEGPVGGRPAPRPARRRWSARRTEAAPSARRSASSCPRARTRTSAATARPALVRRHRRVRLPQSSGQSVFVVTANTGHSWCGRATRSTIRRRTTASASATSGAGRSARSSRSRNGKLPRRRSTSSVRPASTPTASSATPPSRCSNTPIEWNVEGRMKFGPDQHWWAGLTSGTLIVPGYGAPDFRAVAVGRRVRRRFPAPRPRQTRQEIRDTPCARSGGPSTAEDSDGDGIPDDLDACPMENEDHQGRSERRLPRAPGSRRRRHLRRSYDKCPDQPEDKDGIDDGDGCPEDDCGRRRHPRHRGRVPEATGTAQPRSEEERLPDDLHDGRNGHQVRASRSTSRSARPTILPDSFPMLQEVANLMKVNPQHQDASPSRATPTTPAAPI